MTKEKKRKKRRKSLPYYATLKYGSLLFDGISHL